MVFFYLFRGSSRTYFGVFVVSIVSEGSIGQLQLCPLSARWAKNKGHLLATYFSSFSAKFSMGKTYLAQWKTFGAVFHSLAQASRAYFYVFVVSIVPEGTIGQLQLGLLSGRGLGQILSLL